MPRKHLILTLWFALGISAQQIRVTDGITDFQVVQRGPDETADLKFSGATATKKENGREIEARLISHGDVLEKFDWTRIAKVQKQKWSGEIQKVPTGGPYQLQLRVKGAPLVTIVDQILVGDLWILAGQSNMEGHGELIDVQTGIPQVHSFDMADQWLLAEEPLHTQVSAVDRVHWALNENREPERLTGERLERYIKDRKKGAGLGLPFAVEMYRRTGVPVGLIPCAHVGTTMEQWSPSLKDAGGDSLYGAMLRRFRAVGGTVRGVLWYQGESDANPKAAPEFLQRFKDLAIAMREDFNAPTMGIYYVQIGRHVSDSNAAEWNQVQAAQLKAESEIRHAGMVASVDCTLDDPIHVSTESLKRLGHRLADRVCHDLFPKIKNYGALEPGPRPESVRYENGVVKVAFAGVNGKLESDGRLDGFSIHNDKGETVPLIYKAAIDASENAVLLYVGGKLPESATLWYGFGNDPYCNLRDASDQAAPVFGPVAIQ